MGTDRPVACRWCPTPIVRDDRSGWVHVTTSYACRDETNVLLGTTAEPEPTRRPWPNNPPGRYL
ncbi:MAG: hypothetical protein AUI14_12985 [Actinobacteria bacterium 13_2_20CM_2_71_6]|nr:MAG: hypothetical protein AUI14_12985 [Actinobacteria bacterium 13_2_20CM_2_71_6]